MSEVEAQLAARIEQLERKIEELQRKAEPPAPTRVEVRNWQPPGRDYTEGMGMPANAIRAMLDATPDDLMKEIARDRRAMAPASAIPPDAVPRPRAAPLPRGTGGWRDAQPLGNPPGVAQADRLMDAADARDRAALIEAEARRRLKSGG